MHPLHPHWQALWQDAPAHDMPVFDKMFADIIQHYQEPHRHYHNDTHLKECFALFDDIKDKLHRPKLVALALFYHDVIYNPKSASNEADSSHFAQSALMGKLSADDVAVISDYILATKDHINTASNPRHAHDLAYLLDMDLAILGADFDRFTAYNAQIRQEYAWVFKPIYHFKRRQVLQEFYAKQRLFLTDYFYQRLERRAKENLKRVLEG